LTRTFVIPNGIDRRLLAVRKSDASAFVKSRYGLSNYILTVGRIDPRKNHANMLAAYSRLEQSVAPDRLPTFVIVGDVDNAFEEGRSAIQAYVNTHHVVWLRNVSDHELRYLYGAATFTACVSHAEGFGLPILEAMAAGSPVVAGNNTAIPEVAAGCAVLVDSYDVGAIYAGYRRMLLNDTFRNDCAVRGRESTRARTWNEAATSFLDMLDRV
jgi:glycosyltransferase involved in cell wall biosynthesis